MRGLHRLSYTGIVALTPARKIRESRLETTLDSVVFTVYAVAVTAVGTRRGVYEVCGTGFVLGFIKQTLRSEPGETPFWNRASCQ